MRYLLLFITSMFFLTGCVRDVQPITQEELSGIWKLNGYHSTTYVMEITPDGYLYWFNYLDDPHYTREFELQYSINNNTLYLYNPNKNNVIHSVRVYRQRNGQLYFSITNSGTDPNGNPISRTDTYYQM